MKRFSGLVIGLFFFAEAFSQFNDSTFYLVAFSSTGILNKTNDGRSYVLTNGLRYSIKKKSLVFNTGANHIYGEQQSNVTNNDFSAFLDVNLYKTFPNFYYWGLGTYEKSLSLKINRRFQAGLGIAYNFIDTETAYVNLSDGIIYESSDLQVTDTTSNVYHTMRNSLRLRFKFVINKIVTVEATNFWQPSFSDGEDYIIKSNANLGIKLYRWLSFTTALTYNRLNQTRRENMLLNFGLSVEKYF